MHSRVSNGGCFASRREEQLRMRLPENVTKRLAIATYVL